MKASSIVFALAFAFVTLLSAGCSSPDSNDSTSGSSEIRGSTTVLDVQATIVLFLQDWQREKSVVRKEQMVEAVTLEVTGQVERISRSAHRDDNVEYYWCEMSGTGLDFVPVDGATDNNGNQFKNCKSVTTGVTVIVPISQGHKLAKINIDDTIKVRGHLDTLGWDIPWYGCVETWAVFLRMVE